MSLAGQVLRLRLPEQNCRGNTHFDANLKAMVPWARHNVPPSSLMHFVSFIRRGIGTSNLEGSMAVMILNFCRFDHLKNIQVCLGRFVFLQMFSFCYQLWMLLLQHHQRPRFSDDKATKPMQLPCRSSFCNLCHQAAMQCNVFRQ